jgi:hypothetical protein
VAARAKIKAVAAFAVFLVLVFTGVRWWFGLREISPVVVRSWWKRGNLIARGDASAEGTLVEETIVAEAPLSIHPLFFTLGLVPGRDGVKAEIDGREAVATVDDLLSLQAYDREHLVADGSFGWGTQRGPVLNLLAQRLRVEPRDLEARGHFRRVRFAPRATRRITADDLTPELVRSALADAATHLAQSVDGEGRFRYLIHAPTNATIPGYNWPRHSGTTFFLAQAAALLDDAFVRSACLRAAAYLRNQMMRGCGPNKCITEDGEIAEIGSSALAIIAFTEIVRTGADTSYRAPIAELTAYLRSQQRPDGEFQHLYDRVHRTPIDKQFLYYSGEAALALGRAHRTNGDPRDLDAAQRALARISGSGWSFFGSRYYFSEEHWMCQAMAELWDRAPDRAALAFCTRWHVYQRRLQQDADETPFDSDGAFSVGPFVSPRLTPASSRGEAAGALLAVLRREHHPDAPLVERELRRALAFVMRNQLREPGPIFADPVAVRGAVPGSPVDYSLRIDYAQHAGSMMARYIELSLN